MKRKQATILHVSLFSLLVQIPKSGHKSAVKGQVGKLGCNPAQFYGLAIMGVDDLPLLLIGYPMGHKLDVSD